MGDLLRCVAGNIPSALSDERLRLALDHLVLAATIANDRSALAQLEVRQAELGPAGDLAIMGGRHGNGRLSRRLPLATIAELLRRAGEQEDLEPLRQLLVAPGDQQVLATIADRLTSAARALDGSEGQHLRAAGSLLRLTPEMA